MDTRKPKVVDKPWGREIWIAEEEEYAGKILEINSGHRTSLHYHERKKETMYVLKGKLRITDKEGNEKTIHEGETVTIKCGMEHSLEALEDLKLIEVSTPDLSDIQRIRDDYGRI